MQTINLKTIKQRPRKKMQYFIITKFNKEHKNYASMSWENVYNNKTYKLI